jgi:DDE superfamily endonuclease
LNINGRLRMRVSFTESELSRKVAADFKAEGWDGSGNDSGWSGSVYSVYCGTDVGHRPRRSALPLRDYCAGLLTAEGRKSVEPMAAVTVPARVSVQHQKLLHFVGEGNWSDESVLAKHDDFERPVLILRKFNRDAVLVVPLTSRPKENPYHAIFPTRRRHLLGGRLAGQACQHQASLAQALSDGQWRVLECAKGRTVVDTKSAPAFAGASWAAWPLVVQ